LIFIFPHILHHLKLLLSIENKFSPHLFRYQQGEDGIFRAENGHPLPQSNFDSS